MINMPVERGSFEESRDFNSVEDHGAGQQPMLEKFPRFKILQIGNYPPPYCGWAIQTKLLVEEIHSVDIPATCLTSTRIAERRAASMLGSRALLTTCRKSSALHSGAIAFKCMSTGNRSLAMFSLSLQV